MPHLVSSIGGGGGGRGGGGPWLGVILGIGGRVGGGGVLEGLGLLELLPVGVWPAEGGGGARQARHGRLHLDPREGGACH